jgi:hypothetical protein
MHSGVEWVVLEQNAALPVNVSQLQGVMFEPGIINGMACCLVCLS